MPASARQPVQAAQMASDERQHDPQPEQQEESQHRNMGVDDEAWGDVTHGPYGRLGDDAQYAVERILLAVFAGQHRQCALAEQGKTGDLDQGA